LNIAKPIKSAIAVHAIPPVPAVGPRETPGAT
jgi:hypothetical protein